MLAEIIGWTSAIILLLTVGRQVYTEWRDRSVRGLSRWLFVGQLTASAGFIVYSWTKGVNPTSPLKQALFETLYAGAQ